MKKLIIILFVIILIGCEKDEYYESRLLITVVNTLPPGESGISPLGLSFTYLDNGDYKTQPRAMVDR